MGLSTIGIMLFFPFFVLKGSKNCQNVCKEASRASTYQVLPSSEGTRLFSSSYEAPRTIQRWTLGFCGDDDSKEECSREGKTKERYLHGLVFSVGPSSGDSYSDVVFTGVFGGPLCWYQCCDSVVAFVHMFSSTVCIGHSSKACTSFLR